MGTKVLNAKVLKGYDNQETSKICKELKHHSINISDARISI